MSSIWRWGLLAVLWLGFTLWYTNLAGSLSDQEIKILLGRAAEQGYQKTQLKRLERFMREDEGDHFVMVNVLDLAPDAEQNMDRYMAFMWPALLTRACHPVFIGTASGEAMDLIGITAAAGEPEIWDQGVLMRYRSRRDLLAIALNPEFHASHEFKTAALTKTLAFPAAPTLNPGDPRLLLGLLLLIIGLALDRLKLRQRTAGSAHAPT